MIKSKQKTNLRIFQFIVLFLWAMIVFLLILAPEPVHALDPLWKTLETNQGIKDIWRSVMNLVNYFVVAVLIVVAFAQILRINLNTYGFKKVLPALIFAVIAANFSYLICRWFIDLANIAITLLLDFNGTPDPRCASTPPPPEATNCIANTPVTLTGDLKPEWKNPFKSGGSIIETTLQIIFMFITGIMILILAFLLYIRNWVIYFLVPLAPLAFMSTVLPQAKSVFNQWWSNFLKWTFMPVVSIFWLWLGSQWIKTMNAGLFGSGGDMLYLKFAFAILCFYLAITTPMKMGGAVMGQWAGLGKKVWGATGAKGLNYAKKEWLDKRVEFFKNKARDWYVHTAERDTDNPIVAATGWWARRNMWRQIKFDVQKEAVEAGRDSLWRAGIGGKDTDKVGMYVKRKVWKNKKKMVETEKDVEEMVDETVEEPSGVLGPNGQSLMKKVTKQVPKTVRRKVMEEVDDVDPETGKVRMELVEKTVPIYKSRYRSLKDQLWLAERMDQVEGDKGERDWAIKHLQAKFQQTEKGQLSVARSVAGGMRMADTENTSKGIRNFVEAEANLFNPNDPNNLFHRTKAFDFVGTVNHLSKVFTRFRDSQNYLDLSERTKKKAESDAITADRQRALDLEVHLNQYERLNKRLEEVQATIQQSSTLGYDEKQVELLKEQLKALQDQKYYIERALKSQVLSIQDKFYDKETGALGGMSATTRRMLSGFADTNGKMRRFTQDDMDEIDVSKIQRLSDVWGVPEATRGLLASRARKAFSERIKEELSSESGKRDALESLKNLFSEEFEDQIEFFLNGDYGMMDAHKFTDMVGRLANATNKAGGIQNPIYRKVYGELIHRMTEIAGKGEAGEGARQKVAAILNNSLSLGLTKNSVNDPNDRFDPQTEAEQIWRGTQTDATKKLRTYQLTTEERVAALDMFKKNTAAMDQVRKEMMQKLIGHLKLTGDEITTFQQYATIDFDWETGSYKIDLVKALEERRKKGERISAAEYDTHAKLMDVVNKNVISGNFRNRQDEAYMRGHQEGATQEEISRLEAGRLVQRPTNELLERIHGELRAQNIKLVGAKAAQSDD